MLCTLDKKKVLIKCDNAAVVDVLTHGRTKDAFLATCARNIWQEAALQDGDLVYAHILGRENVIADLLSRWSYTSSNIIKLHAHVEKPLWLQLNEKY